MISDFANKEDVIRLSLQFLSLQIGKKTLTHRWLMIIIMNNMVILHHTSWGSMMVAASLAHASWPKDLLYFVVVLVVVGVPPTFLLSPPCLPPIPHLISLCSVPTSV